MKQVSKSIPGKNAEVIEKLKAIKNQLIALRDNAQE